MKKTYRIKLDFDAAHFLRDYDGPCANMHGHTWKVEFYISVPTTLDKVGIGIDFKALKESLKMVLPDHKNLNELYAFDKANPTAENIVEWLFYQVDRFAWIREGVQVEKVVLWETEKNGIEASRS